MNERNARAILILGLLSMALAGCAAKRPVLYADPTFTKRHVLNQKTAFLIAQPIDISPVVQQFVSAFDGNAAAGAAFATSAIRAYLTGEKLVGNIDSSYRLHLMDAPTLFPGDSIATAFETSRDAYGILHIDRTDLPRIEPTLRGAGLDYLILVYGLNITTASTAQSPGAIYTPTGPVFYGGGVSQWANMGAQVFVWDVASSTVVWNGFVNGRQSISAKLTRNTVAGAASDWANDLINALR